MTLISPLASQGWSKPPPSYPNQTAPDHGGGGQGGVSTDKPTQSPTSSDNSANSQQQGSTTLWDNVNMFYTKYPYLSAFVTVSIKAALADGLAQANEFNPKFNPWRNLAFFLYGGLYQGCAQNWIYNVWFPQMFGNGADFFTVLKKVCFDSMVITTIICLPSAYILKAIVFQYGPWEAWIRYYTDITENGLFFYYWTLWIPVQSCTFSIVPEQFRILFIAVVSFFWVIILSTISAKGDAQRNNKLKEEEAGAAGSSVMMNPMREERDISYIKYQKQPIRSPAPRRTGTSPAGGRGNGDDRDRRSPIGGTDDIEVPPERQSLTIAI